MTETIRENIRAFCWFNNIRERIVTIADELQGLEDDLARYTDLLPERLGLTGKGMSQVHIRSVLTAVNEESRNFDQDDLDLLEMIIEGGLKDESTEPTSATG